MAIWILETGGVWGSGVKIQGPGSRVQGSEIGVLKCVDHVWRLYMFFSVLSFLLFLSFPSRQSVGRGNRLKEVSFASFDPPSPSPTPKTSHPPTSPPLLSRNPLPDPLPLCPTRNARPPSSSHVRSYGLWGDAPAISRRDVWRTVPLFQPLGARREGCRHRRHQHVSA